MEEDDQLRNPYPSPPSHFSRYTDENLKLLSTLGSRSSQFSPTASQHDILAGESNVPDWALKDLEKPRVDWILEDGEFTVYGDPWPVR